MPVSSVDVTFSQPINLSTFDYHDLTLTHNGAAVALNNTVTTSLVSGNTYHIGGLSGFNLSDGKNDGTYVLTVKCSGIQDLAGNAGTGSASDTWVMDTVPPTITSLAAVTPSPRNTPVPSVDVVFSKPMDLSTFTYQDLTLTRNGVAVALSNSIIVSSVSGTTYRIGGLSAFTASDGAYVLTLNDGGIQDLAGNLGTGSASDTWATDTVPPTVTVTPLVTNNSYRPTLTGTVNDAAPSSGIAGVTVVVGTQTLTATVDGHGLERGGAGGPGRRDVRRPGHGHRQRGECRQRRHDQ